MVTFLVFIILVYILIVFVFIIVYTLILVRVVVMAEAAHVIARLPLLAETVLGLAHLIVILSTEHCVFVFSIIVEYLFFLSLLLLLLKGFNDFRLLLPPLSVL